MPDIFWLVSSSVDKSILPGLASSPGWHDFIQYCNNLPLVSILLTRTPCLETSLGYPRWFYFDAPQSILTILNFTRTGTVARH